MSRNKENIAFQNARRSNNPIYGLGKTLPSDDFFTDSLLDSSKIPTPSPTRPLTGVEPSYKPRRAIGNAKTLKAAWDGSAKPTRTHSAGSDRSRPRSQHLKPPTPLPPRDRSPAPSRQENPTSTPSPPIRSQSSLTSPTTESSPPKGLTDVYQRIADEEDLASQEGEDFDDEDYTEESMAGSVAHLSNDRALLERIRKSRSPNSLPGSRRRSPESRVGDANKENRQNGDTVMSEASGISFLQGLTDQDLAAKLTPHTMDRAKDRARLDKALHKESPIAFSRAYNRHKGGLAAESADKDNPMAFSRAHAKPKATRSPESTQNFHGKDNEGDITEGSSTGSAMTETSEPPLNVPRTWGSRGKVGKDWLQRTQGRHSSSHNLASKNLMPESSQIDWTAAAAEVALPSIEGSSTPKYGSPGAPAPATLHKQSSLDKIQEWDFNDFTGQSLQVSNTPPVKVRTNVILDQVRDKEIESLEKRAVTTNRLGEIRKKDSRELLRKISRSPSIGAGQRDLPKVEDISQARVVNLEDEGESIPDTPIVIYKTSSNGVSEEPDAKKILSRPTHDRQDSRNNLQKLARAMSDSPRPSSSPEDWSLVGKEEHTIGLAAKASGEAANPILHLDLTRRSSKQVADVESTPQGMKAADYAKTPVVTGAWLDTVLPDTIKTVKHHEDSTNFIQTPYVNAGGWIDTPMPNGKRQSSALAPMRVQDIPEGLTDGLGEQPSQPSEVDEKPAGMELAKSQTEIPKSALASILDKAKRKLSTGGGPDMRESNDTLNLGDATIESLEDLLTLDNADMTTLIRMGAEFNVQEQLFNGGEIDDGSAEAELLDRLGSKLDRLLSSIHDARKGISKLEHQVSHPDPSVDSKAMDNNGPCEACGCPRSDAGSFPSATSSKVYLAIPIPRFFHDRGKDHRVPRPTLLGWVTFALAVWYLSESTMCEYYCHPLYADFYDWPEEPEPRFGYALPTMLWRWSRIREFGPMLLGPLWVMLVAFVRILGQAFGLTDGFVDDLPARSTGLPVPAALDGSFTKVGLGPDLSMMNDEYI